MPCCLTLGKVERWYDLGELRFWVWPYLCGGTASLKFRQFNSAVCDAFGVFWYLDRVCVWCGLVGGYRIVRVVSFSDLGGCSKFWGRVLVFYWVVRS